MGKKNTYKIHWSI